ncbi:TetR/AcrR family transcriptional regulator [Desertihabitans aurantiacus]|uniref:TetR/AcrR family transcriptional regulator n=1 Tax=Desertihabitans aurantiacus TaxID=2282477 RepID=UPI000DF7348A|nr:TetR/AcrR family transcriptional regulator [Desertihabitans aurantiacus]
MPRPPAARAKVLDAFARVLIEDGERSATIEAVAARAGVTKGGLLYHFASREALVDGLLERLEELGREDVAAMRSAPEGPVQYYLRTSDVSSSDEFSDLVMAAMRLTQDAGTRARAQLRRLEARWLEVLTEEIGDPARARLVLLVGDGLYWHQMMARGGGASQLRAILPVVEELLG